MQTGDVFAELGAGLDLDELFPVDHFFDSYVSKLEGSSCEDFVYDKATKSVMQKPQPQLPNSAMARQQEERNMLAADSAYLHHAHDRQGYASLQKPVQPINVQPFPSSQHAFAPELHQRNEFQNMDWAGAQMGDSLGFKTEMQADLSMEPLPFNETPSVPGMAAASTVRSRITRTSSKTFSGTKTISASKSSLARSRNRTVRQQALNKQAQQRYRQRKKARAVELEHTVQTLTEEIVQLKAIKEEKRALEERALDLERSLLEKEAEIQQLKMNPPSKRGTSKSSDGSEASSTGVDRDDKDPSVDQLATDFHQKVDDLKTYLTQNGIAPSQRVSPHSQGIPGHVIKEVAKRLADVSALCMRLTRLEGPNVWELIQAKTNRAMSFDPIGEEQWFRTAESLQLTEEQVATASRIRQQCLERLEKIYVDRQNLNLHAIGLLLPSEQGGHAPRFGTFGCFVLGSFIARTKHTKKTHAVLEKLKSNLRQEQKLLAEVDYMTFHRVVNPLQGAWAKMGMYPHHCDALCLLNAIHEQYQNRSQSQVMSGGGSQTS